MKKADKEKMDEYLQKMVKVYQYCFDPDQVTTTYLNRFAHNRYESAIYNNEIGKLALDVLGGEITNISEGIEDEKINNEIQTYFIKKFKEYMKEQLIVRKQEIADRKKKEKEEKKESKK